MTDSRTKKADLAAIAATCEMNYAVASQFSDDPIVVARSLAAKPPTLRLSPRWLKPTLPAVSAVSALLCTFAAHVRPLTRPKLLCASLSKMLNADSRCNLVRAGRPR